MPQIARANLLARVIATSMRGFLASIRSNHEPCEMRDRLNRLIRDIAPMIKSRLMSAQSKTHLRLSHSNRNRLRISSTILLLLDERAPILRTDQQNLMSEFHQFT